MHQGCGNSFRRHSSEKLRCYGQDTEVQARSEQIRREGSDEKCQVVRLDDDSLDRQWFYDKHNIGRYTGKGRRQGFNIDALPSLAYKEIVSILDALGNSTEVLGCVTFKTELREELRNVMIHIVRTSDEILLGMNALRRLRVEVTINERIYEHKTWYDTEAHIPKSFRK